MAICDLSSNNPNVLYELGLRHAYDKPVVLIHDERTNRIFDIQGISIIQYRSSRLYDEVIEDRKKILEAIIETEGNSSGYSIVNMINLKKATYDTNIKETDFSKINNALLLRILNALEKREQDVVYAQNQIQNKESDVVNKAITKITNKVYYFLDALTNTPKKNDPDFLAEAYSELNDLKKIANRYLMSSATSPLQIGLLKLSLKNIQTLQEKIINGLEAIQ